MEADHQPTTRRSVLKDSASAGAGLVALSSLTAGSFAGVLGANDRVRIGVIGDRRPSHAIDGPLNPQTA